MLPGRYKKRLLAGRGTSLWDVQVFADEKDGLMYLTGGREDFICANDLHDCDLLVFCYDKDAGTLAITIFDLTTCCKQNVHAGTAATSSSPAQVVRCTVKKGAKLVTYYKDVKSGRWCSPPTTNQIAN